MNRIYVPSSGAESWRTLLAKPDLHWAKGYSARTVAHAWEHAKGLPAEVSAVLEPHVGPAELLIGIPEHKVPLPGGVRESQCDVFALLKAQNNLITCAIEGKVDEPFGPMVDEWLATPSPGKTERLGHIAELLGLTEPIPAGIRYQLLHRTASAVIEARRFSAPVAAMIVHSFSPEKRWFKDYAAFVGLFDTEHDASSARVTLPDGRTLILGWAAGDQIYRQM